MASEHRRYDGDHIDYAHSIFHGPVTGKVEGDLHQVFIQWVGTGTPSPRQIIEGDIPQKPRGFQLRGDLLDRLHMQVVGSGAAVICAVTGTPGVGKTLLAASYAWACQRARWPLVAWIAAETTDQIITGLAGLADRLGLRQPNDDAATAARRARAHLAASTQPGLLVFDNAVSVAQVRDWSPATGAIRVVITSRHRSFGLAYPSVEVETFTPTQAVTFLAERTSLDDPERATKLAVELGYLPLALSQAAAVIARHRLDYTVYMELLHNFPLERYLPRSDHDPYPASTAQTILLSVTQAEASHPSASFLLTTLAALAPSGVPRAVLYGTSTPTLADREQWDAMLAEIADTSLITFSEDGGTVLMHRLTQRVIRERAHFQGDLPAVLDNAIALLYRFGEGLPDEAAQGTRPAVEVLAEQTAAMHTIASGTDAYPHNLLLLRTLCGQYLTDLADLDRAISLLKATLIDSERLLGHTHPDTLARRSHLANAYQTAGQLTEAIRLHETTLADSEHVLGATHPDTQNNRNNLAYTYEAAGHLDEAIRLHEMTLAEYERIAGPEHPSTLTSRSNLARAYHAVGRLAEAIRLHETTLSKRESILGSTHPHTLASRYNLARSYESAGRLDEAILLYETTLTEFERILGADHPYTLASRQNLANAYQAVGRWDEGIQLHEAALTKYEQVLGADHLHTVDSRHNLAHAYHAAGRLHEAIPLYEATLAARERLLDPGHPDTLVNRNNLAGAYQEAGQLGEAIKLHEATLTERSRFLGPDHPDTLASGHNLAHAYQAAGRLDEAITLYEATLAARERLLDPAHPHTLTNRNNLAYAYYDAGRLNEAMKLFEAMVCEFEQVLGLGHRDTLTSRHNLAVIYQAIGHLDKAILLDETALIECERILGPNHTLTQTVRVQLDRARGG
ncbi:tetratricopeptide repeat protein [Nonomuraea mangrovi]|uniref:Tetratricopeptide repeat protein n=1 Tax=Nonomuraea mangrovi TaxID=2316207 RepID=A0ABW4TG25_9ACTN